MLCVSCGLIVESDIGLCEGCGFLTDIPVPPIVAEISPIIADHPYALLIERKSYGFLKHTNQDFKAVCEYCELTLQHIIKTEKSFETDIFRKACVKILQDVFEKNSRLFEDLDAHSQDFSIFGSHKIIVVKLIIHIYMTLRFYYIEKVTNQNMKDMIRTKLSRYILFKNE